MIRRSPGHAAFLAFTLALLTGCPFRDAREPQIHGLSRGAFDNSLRSFHHSLPPDRWDAFARTLLFLHLEDPLEALSAPAHLDALLDTDFSSDLRIHLNRFTPDDLTRFARGRFQGLVRQLQQNIAVLDESIAERSDEIAAARDSQAILRDIVISPERVRLERVPGLSVVRATIPFENRTNRPLSAILLRVRLQIVGGGMAQDDLTINFNPVLTAGESRDVDRILAQAIVPESLDPDRLNFTVINAYDQRQSPLARILDRGAEEALARLRTERAEIEARIARIGRADNYPYLRLRPGA